VLELVDSFDIFGKLDTQPVRRAQITQYCPMCRRQIIHTAGFCTYIDRRPDALNAQKIVVLFPWQLLGSELIPVIVSRVRNGFTSPVIETGQLVVVEYHPDTFGEIEHHIVDFLRWNRMQRAFLHQRGNRIQRLSPGIIIVITNPDHGRCSCWRLTAFRASAVITVHSSRDVFCRRLFERRSFDDSLTFRPDHGFQVERNKYIRNWSRADISRLLFAVVVPEFFARPDWWAIAGRAVVFDLQIFYRIVLL